MARRMKLSDQIATLQQRVGRFEARVDERFEAIDRRFEAIDKRFEAIDKRFEAIDKRFDTVDARFDELRRHFDVVAEASREDFRNLYDLIEASIERSGARIDRLAVDLRAETRLADAALDRRITALERRMPGGEKRGRR
jgi:chromosome segregation ATPase